VLPLANRGGPPPPDAQVCHPCSPEGRQGQALRGGQVAGLDARAKLRIVVRPEEGEGCNERTCADPGDEFERRAGADWARVDYGPIDYQDLYYYHAIEPTRTQSMLPNRGTTSPVICKGPLGIEALHPTYRR
jgi:hypothetical protein